MDETSYIGKLICAALMALILGWLLHAGIGQLMPVTDENQASVNLLKLAAAGFGGLMGGWLGYKSAELIITSAVYTSLAALITGMFS